MKIIECDIKGPDCGWRDDCEIRFTAPIHDGCCNHSPQHLEAEIIYDGGCPKCVAGIGPHRNCIMR